MKKGTMAVPPNSETNSVVETTEILQTLPDSDISQTIKSSTMDIVSMALSNVTEASNLMTVVDTNSELVEHVETVQQYDEQVEVVEQQVVHEIPISTDMVITSADGQIILPSNSTPAELSAVETLVGGALSQPTRSDSPDSASMSAAAPDEAVDATASTVSLPMRLTFADHACSESAVPIVNTSNPGVVNVVGGARGISASSLLGSIATMIDSTEASIHHANSPLVVGNTTMTPSNVITSTVPAIGNFVSSSEAQGVTTVDVSNNVMSVTSSSSSQCSSSNTRISSSTRPGTVSTNVTTLGLNSVITTPTAQVSDSSLPSTITIKTPPGSNSVSQTLLNSILNNSDVQTLLRRNPGQPITIVRVPEDSPGSGGRNVNKITVTTGTSTSSTAKRQNVPPQLPALKTLMRISTPVNKSSPTTKRTTNNATSTTQRRKISRPSKTKELPQAPVVVKSKKTRSGRVSRPPIHRVRDYKTIHIKGMGEGNEDREVFDDYDGELLSQSQLDFPTYGGRPRSFKCDKCDKAYIGKGGLARHFKNNPNHGDPAELGITYDEDECAHDHPQPPTSEQITPMQTGAPIVRKKRRGRPPLRAPNGDPDFHPNKQRTPPKAAAPKTAAPKTLTLDLATKTLHKQKQRIQELMRTIGDEDLMELALPRLSKAISVWEFLVMKVGGPHSQKPQFHEILQQFENVCKHMKLFANECLERASAKQDPDIPTTNNRPESRSQRDQETLAETSCSKLPAENAELDKENPDVLQDNLFDEGSLQENKSSENGTPITSTSKTDTTPDDTSDTKTNRLSGSTHRDILANKTDVKTPLNDENAEAEMSLSSSESPATVENKVDDTRTDNKEADTVSNNIHNENQTENVSDALNLPSPADPKESLRVLPETVAPPETLELQDTMAKALDMVAGSYRVKDWPLTELPTICRFAKPTEDHEDSPSEEEEICNAEEEEEEHPTAAKRARLNQQHAVVERPMPPMQPISNPYQTTRQEIRIQVPEATNVPALKPYHPPAQTKLVSQLTAELKRNQVSNSITNFNTLSGGGDADASSIGGQQEVCQVVESPFQHIVQQAVNSSDTTSAGEQEVLQQVVQQVVGGSQVVPQTIEEPMAISGQVIEQVQEIVENPQEPEETEGVSYQTEEQSHSIVPEGSTIMQMEDGTFLVQKPDGTAMQIHCPEGMTIETIQALLSMDAGNILQPSE